MDSLAFLALVGMMTTFIIGFIVGIASYAAAAERRFGRNVAQAVQAGWITQAEADDILRVVTNLMR